MAGGGWLGGWLAGWLAGWVGGWLVGKSDFNENPVVSPDLDLDFGLRLIVILYVLGLIFCHMIPDTHLQLKFSCIFKQMKSFFF